MARTRVDKNGAAELLEVAPRTIDRYVLRYAPGEQEPHFPAAVDGQWSVTDLKAWDKARAEKRATEFGRPKGQAPAGKACDSCGTVVPRRKADTAADGSEVLVCNPCWKQDAAAYKQAGWQLGA